MKLVIFAALAMVAVATASPYVDSIVATAQATPELSTLVKVLTDPRYKPVLNVLEGSGPFTVFAPTNDAFAAAGIDIDRVELVTAVLEYHVLAGRILSSDLLPLQFPNTLSADPTYTHLGGAGQHLTVAADASGVHLSPAFGSGEANVTTANVICTNGVVHIIDNVLKLPFATSHTATAAGLTDLVKYAVEEHLAEVVDNKANLTIFAPTNEALQKAGAGKLDKKTLAKVLTYHVVPVVAFSTDLSQNEMVPTLEGSQLKVTLNNGGVQVNGINVIAANVLTANGVVHVIDGVLLPTENF